MCLAAPGKIISLGNDDPLFRTGWVDFGGIEKEVNISLVPEVEIGNYVIVHAGFALSIIDETEAKKVFEYLDEINRLGKSADT